MNLNLKKLDLKTFTEQNALDYCHLNNLNIDKIKKLNMINNRLTDISGIKVFKNLEILWLSFNEINDITDLKYLNNITEIYLNNNNIINTEIIKYLNKLKILDLRYNKINKTEYFDKIETVFLKGNCLKEEFYENCRNIIF